ncbi:hypothetical protein P879_10261 [Paragonimus westermani]|uniref:Sema domain-containing protein n=1 Tax=Paragonimus westermani TaxID=34504 RepID=A0A8T0DDV8_9TREM|nr:hypothetical protein P879_10261 [Paragonimus westermani]
MVISRVGRVCLSDKGGRDGRLRSFAKATIVCPSKTRSQAESTALVHREVTAVYVDQSTKTMFAVFTTPRTMPPSSSVCAYRLTDIEDVFKGPFYTSNGEPTKFNNANDCEKSNLPTTSLEHHQMYRTVRPKLDQSIMRKEKVRWSNLVVDWMPTTLKTDNNLILFTVDPDRQIISKWHHFKGETCLIEELRVLRTPPRTADTDGERVLRLELIRAGQAKEVRNTSFNVG